MKLDKPQLRDTFEVFSEFARIHLINIQGNLEGTLGAQQNSPSFFFFTVFHGRFCLNQKTWKWFRYLCQRFNFNAEVRYLEKFRSKWYFIRHKYKMLLTNCSFQILPTWKTNRLKILLKRWTWRSDERISLQQLQIWLYCLRQAISYTRP